MNPHTFQIGLADLAFLGVIFIGLTFALLLWFTKKKNQVANRFLALALIVMVLQVYGALNYNTLLPHFSLAFGPLLFLYVLKLTRPPYKFTQKHLLHFVPVLLELIIPAKWVLNALVFLVVMIYLFLSRRQIELFYQRQKFNSGDRYRYELSWLDKLLLVFGLLWLLWIPVTTLDYLGYYYQSGINAYDALSLSLAGITIWIAARAHLKSGSDVRADNMVPPVKVLLPADFRQKAAWLKKTVHTNFYYLDPELSLNSLAEKLGMSSHELSRIINTGLKKSFNEFISGYRVDDVIRKMQDPSFDHITLLGIAYESGFNSKSTFNRIFKEITGKSPVEYKNVLKKRVRNL